MNNISTSKEYIPKEHYDYLLKKVNQLSEMLTKSLEQTDELIKIIKDQLINYPNKSK